MISFLFLAVLVLFYWPVLLMCLELLASLGRWLTGWDRH